VGLNSVDSDDCGRWFVGGRDGVRARCVPVSGSARLGSAALGRRVILLRSAVAHISSKHALGFSAVRRRRPNSTGFTSFEVARRGQARCRPRRFSRDIYLAHRAYRRPPRSDLVVRRLRVPLRVRFPRPSAYIYVTDKHSPLVKSKKIERSITKFVTRDDQGAPCMVWD